MPLPIGVGISGAQEETLLVDDVAVVLTDGAGNDLTAD